MKEFVFNAHNCCLNPNSHEIIKIKHFEMSIETAQYFGLYWCVGYSWRFDSSGNYGFEGAGSAASIPAYPNKRGAVNHFETEEAAIKKQKERFYKYFSNRSEWIENKDPVYGQILKRSEEHTS